MHSAGWLSEYGTAAGKRSRKQRRLALLDQVHENQKIPVTRELGAQRDQGIRQDVEIMMLTQLAADQVERLQAVLRPRLGRSRNSSCSLWSFVRFRQSCTRSADDRFEIAAKRDLARS